MIYLIEDGKETFNLRPIVEGDVGRCPEKRVDPRWISIPEAGNDYSFVIAAKTLAGGELRQREWIKKLTNKRTRNLKSGVERTCVYLALTLLPGNEKKGEELNIETAEKQLRDVLHPVKASLGWPAVNPVEWGYQITAEVLAVATSDSGRSSLAMEIPHGTIFKGRLDLIETRLTLDIQDEAKPILATLRRTASRDHLALISLGADRDGNPRVVIVDEAKNRLELPAWKFCDVLAHPEVARRLYTFPAEYQRERYPEVVFNEERVGDLVGKYEPEASVLSVMVVASVRGGRTDVVSRRVIFYLDQDYLVCLWIVLNRITADHERYRVLIHRAEAQIDVDPFAPR